jgi:hypothetical protein
MRCNGVMKKNQTVPSPELVKGQLWQFGGRCIEIRHVGLRLVQHRAMSLLKKRSQGQVCITAITEVQKWIVQNHAVRVTI